MKGGRGVGTMWGLGTGKKGNGCAQYDTYDCYDGEMDGRNEELMEELR